MRGVSLIGVWVLMLAACAAPAAAPVADTMMKPTDEAMMSDEAMMKPTDEAMMSDDAMMKPTDDHMGESADGAMMKPTDDAMMNIGPAWLDIELTDVNSGQAFKLADFKGQVVLVEGMAAWCTSCLRQQRELVKLHEAIGEAAISVAIDVDLNENAALLKRHSETNGFNWRYAVGTPELIEALAAEFGNRFLNPPSVPMFLLDKEGGVHLLDFGHKSVEYLTQQIELYQ
jgi:thiol-disulfide isomerase/thioredoxin